MTSIDIRGFPAPTRIIRTSLGIWTVLPTSAEQLDHTLDQRIGAWVWKHDLDAHLLGLSLMTVNEPGGVPLVRYALSNAAHRAALEGAITEGRLHLRPAASIINEHDGLHDGAGRGYAFTITRLDRRIISEALRT